MTYAAHIRAILILGLPLIGGHLGQMAIGVTDSVMLGWYGVEALAAITMASSYYHLFFLFGSGFAWAVMPMVATFAAEGDEIALRRATRMGLWLSAVFALVALPFLIFAEPVLVLLGQSPEVARGGAEYLRIAGWGIFPALGVMVIKSYLAALEHTRPILWIILASAVVNALFNWILIFGNWGAPEMGLAGAAWASILTQLFTLAGVILYAVRVFPQHELFARLWRADMPMLRRVFRLGAPIGMTTLSEVGLFTASAMMMGWLGTVPQAAHGAALQITALAFMVHMGLSNAATVRAGNAYGRHDRAHLVRGAQVVIALSLLASAVTILVFLLIPDWLIWLFIRDGDPAAAQVLEIGVGLLAIAALFQLVDGLQAIALGLLRGVQDTRVPMWMAAFSYWGIGITGSYVLGFVLGWGGAGVWFGLVLGLACAGISLMYRFWGPVLRGISEPD